MEAINKLADQMKEGIGIGELPKRMSDIESKLTEKIKNRSAKYNGERNYENEKRISICDMEHETQRPIIEGSNNEVDRNNRSLNIVVHNLPESRKENTTEKVNTLIKADLRERNVIVANALRKEDKSTENDVIIASCKKIRKTKKT